MSALLSDISAANDGKEGAPPGRFHAAGGPPARGRTPRADAGLASRPARVLVIDDEVENLELVRRYLQRHFAVDTTPSPASALQMLEREHYDIIISDQRMPHMSGSHLLGESRRLAPDAVRIVITGYADHDATIEAINVGAVSGYIQKPFAARTLLEAIQSQLEPAERPVDRRFDRLHRLLDQLPDPHAILEADTVVYANRAMADLYRVPNAEMLYGRGLTQLLAFTDTEVDWACAHDVASLARVGGLQVPVAARRAVVDDAVILRLYATASTARAAARPGTSSRLLLVDSNPLMLRSLRRQLSQAFEVRCAVSVAEACAALEAADTTDLVITDDRLDDGTAEDLLAHIRTLRPRLAGRLLTLSARPEAHGPAARGPGGGPLLAKPFVPDELHQAIAKVLGDDPPGAPRGANA